MILVYEVCLSFVSLHSDSIVINITWWYVAYVLKVYIHIHSKTQLCLLKETISIIHTCIYMNNLVLCLVCYFCTFLFKHVWRKRIKISLHLFQRTMVSEKEEEGHKFFRGLVENLVPFFFFFFQKLFIYSHWGFYY